MIWYLRLLFVMRGALRPARILFVLLGMAHAATPLEAATFYVSTSGNDAHSCDNAQDITTPKRTINSARNCPSAGDTVYVRGGTYVEELSWYGGPRGQSWSAPITFAAYPGESVTIRPNRGAERVLTLSNSARGVDNGSQYLIFDGLTFDGTNATYDVVKIAEWDGLVLSRGGFPARHIRFTNFRFTANSAPREMQGILIGGDDVQLIRGEIDHIGADTSQTGNSQGIYGAANDLLVDRVRVHHIQGYGMSNINSTTGVTAINHTIKNCIVHDNLKGGINEGEGTGHSIFNNIVYNNDAGIQINAWGAGSSSGIKIFNNTVYNNVVGIEIGLSSSNTNTVVVNNISFGNRDNYINDEGTTVESHNLFGVDPLFIDAGGRNFKLQTGSPAIDRGTAVAEVTTDIAASPRPSGMAYDIGAHETGDLTPLRPAGVRIVAQ